MKKINILISSLLLITALVFVFQACQKQITTKKEEVSKQTNSIELRDHDCIPPGWETWCNPDGWQTFTEVIYLHDYPNCPVTITGQTNHCNAFGGKKWLVKDLRFLGADWSSPDCHKLLIDIIGGILNPSQPEQEAFFNHLWNQIYEAYARKFAEYLATQYPPETIRCGFSISDPVIEFYVESCYKVCICGTGDPEDPYTITKNPCGNGCCQRSYEWCLDENDELQVNVTVTPLSNCTQIYETDCNTESCSETQCLKWCNL